MATLDDLIKKWPHFYLQFSPIGLEQRGFDVEIRHGLWSNGYEISHRISLLGNRRSTVKRDTLEDAFQFVLDTYSPKEQETQVKKMKITLSKDDLMDMIKQQLNKQLLKGSAEIVSMTINNGEDDLEVVVELEVTTTEKGE